MSAQPFGFKVRINTWNRTGAALGDRCMKATAQSVHTALTRLANPAGWKLTQSDEKHLVVLFACAQGHIYVARHYTVLGMKIQANRAHWIIGNYDASTPLEHIHDDLADEAALRALRPQQEQAA